MDVHHITKVAELGAGASAKGIFVCHGTCECGRPIPGDYPGAEGLDGLTTKQVLPNMLPKPEYVKTGVPDEVIRRIVRGEAVPVLKVDAGNLANVIWAYGFLHQIVAAQHEQGRLETRPPLPLRFPVPFEVRTGPLRDCVTWVEHYSPTAHEMDTVRPFYEAAVACTLATLSENVKPGPGCLHSDPVVSLVTLLLLMAPFRDLFDPEHLKDALCELSPDWGLRLEQLRALEEQPWGNFGEVGRRLRWVLAGNIRAAQHLRIGVWTTVAEVVDLLCSEPASFPGGMGVVPDIQAALKTLRGRLMGIPVTVCREPVRSPLVSGEALCLQDELVPLRNVLVKHAGPRAWRSAVQQGYLKGIWPIGEFIELNSPPRSIVMQDGTPGETVRDWRELVAGDCYALPTYGVDLEPTAFIMLVNPGMVAVVPKGTTESQLAQMLPELAVGGFYVPAWDLLRRGLLGETCGQPATIDATEPAAPISPAQEQPPSPVTLDGVPLYSREVCAASRRRIEDVLLLLGHANPLVGESDAILQIYPALERIHMNRRRRLNILLLGEPGSGKQVLAEMIHVLSGREVPIVQENAPSMQGQLALAALFGARKGSWTGIDEDREGLFARAADGVLFLDNMQRSDVGTQAAILNAIEQRPGEFRRLGDTDSQPTTCWLVAAINESVNALVAHGRLVPDLPRRFDYTVEVPALKDRLTDMPLLVRHFVCLRAREEGFSAPDELVSLVQTDEIIRKCQATDWAAPVAGNVGGLKNMVNRLLDDQLILLRKEGRLPLPEERLLELPPHEFSEYLAATLPDGTGPLVSRDWGGMLCDPGRVVRAIRDSKGNTDDLSKELLGGSYDYLMRCLVERCIEENRDAERAWRPFYLLLAKWLQHQRQRQTGRASRKQLPAR